MGKKLESFGISLVFCAMFLAQPLGAAETEHSFNLHDAVNMAIRTNPEYAVAASERNIAVEQLSGIRGGYFPSIDLEAAGGKERLSSPVIAQTETLWRRSGSVSLTQLLFDGMETRNAVRSQEYRVKSAAYRLRETTEFLGLDVVQAYLDVLRQRSLLTIARKNMKEHLDILDKVKAGRKAGTLTTGDVAQVEARVNNARASLSVIEQDLRGAEALFIQKVGEMPGQLAAPSVPRESLPPTAEEVIAAAARHAPTLRAYEAEIKSAEAEYDRTASAFSPKVDLEVNASQGANMGGVSGSHKGFSALAVMRWNLSRGGTDAARRREFQYRHAAARQRADLALRQIEKDIRDTWAARESAERRAQEFRYQAKASKKVVLVYMDQFTMNRRTLLDVLNAQSELFSAGANYINALYAEAFGVYRLLAQEGRMLEVIGVALRQDDGLGRL